MNEFRLFVHVLDDLRVRVVAQPRDAYELLKASALIRQLLMDSEPLLHRVNREIRQPVRFLVNADSAVDDYGLTAQTSMRWVNVSPLSFQSRAVKLDDFLGFKCVKVDDHKYSVRDIVATAAHVLGGVHKFNAQTAHEAALVALNERLELNDVGAVLEQIVGIGRVTVEALEGIYSAAGSRA